MHVELKNLSTFFWMGLQQAIASLNFVDMSKVRNMQNLREVQEKKSGYKLFQHKKHSLTIGIQMLHSGNYEFWISKLKYFLMSSKRKSTGLFTILLDIATTNYWWLIWYFQLCPWLSKIVYTIDQIFHLMQMDCWSVVSYYMVSMFHWNINDETHSYTVRKVSWISHVILYFLLTKLKGELNISFALVTAPCSS